MTKYNNLRRQEALLAGSGEEMQQRPVNRDTCRRRGQGSFRVCVIQRRKVAIMRTSRNLGFLSFAYFSSLLEWQPCLYIMFPPR